MTEPTTERLLETKLDVTYCPNCKHNLESHLFPPGHDECIACCLNFVYSLLEPLERFSNNNRPKGFPIKIECSRCKVVNWWSNLKRYPHPNGWSEQYFCSQCLSEQSVKDYYDEQEKKIEEYQARARAKAVTVSIPADLDALDIEI